MPDPVALSLVPGAPLAGEAGQGAHTIAGYLREVAARHGPNEAVVTWLDGARLSWTYDDLLAQSLAVARSLAAGGIGKDGRVGILMSNRPEFLAALFGIALAGGVSVAMSTFSTESELDHQIRASQIGWLLYEPEVAGTDFHTMLAGLGALPFLRRRVSLGAEWSAFVTEGIGIADTLVMARAAAVHPADTGGIFFSSGTTSLPKGIVHSQRAFAIQWWRWPRVFAMHEPVRSWTGNGFFWSGNISMVVGTALSTGGAVVLQRYFDAEEALRLIERERVTFINGRPHQWARLQAAPNWTGANLSSLKYVPRGELICAHPTVRTDWQVPMSFGTTETMTICTSFTADAEAVKYAGSFGEPLPGNVLKIMDPLTGALLPVGVVGEMCIKGPTLMSGYLGKASEECFDAEGFYCTGDSGYVDAEGRFYWEGRLTEMIKTGGANVSPQEVDEVIARFPGVKRTQTVGVPDALLDEVVVSCVVPADGVMLDPAALVAFVKSEIAAFKAPRRVLVFAEDDFAVTGNEKIRPAEVRALAMQRIGQG